MHRSLLAGLLGNLGSRPPDEPTYAGTHQVRFAIHPSSSVLKKAPRWLMAAEIVETRRVYARTLADGSSSYSVGKVARFHLDRDDYPPANLGETGTNALGDSERSRVV